MLAREAGIRVIPSARREAPLKDLAESLGLDEILTIDRDTLDAATLHTHDVDVVVDASGPFQLQHPKVVQEAINAGVHYLDLADGREFVAGINRFDQAARQANVAVISGASSTPALSHAVIDSLCSGWSQIDSLQANICPSNRQTVGLAVVRAILSTVGQPVRVFENGSWTSSYGWSDTRRLQIKGAGLRFVSLVETPDLHRKTCTSRAFAFGLAAGRHTAQNRKPTEWFWS